MTNLTEQWKKGELPEGFYWIEFQDGEITPTTFSNQHGFICCDSLCDDEHIKQIPAEMPSYEEWQDVKDDLATCDKDLNNVCEQKEELYEENEQLKEMLKECKHIMSIEKDFASCHFEKDKLCKLLTKINQVLGEE